MAQPSLAPHITVHGDVEGSIVNGDNNFVVNRNHGTIVFKQAPPRVKRRDAVPQPPRRPRGFVDRAEELAHLDRLIASNEAITVSGPEGMGKTALLKQAANGPAARAMPDGILVVGALDERGEALGLEDVIQRSFDALFESDPPLKVDATTARTYLSNTRPLVLLDGLNLPAGSPATLADLFPGGAVLIAAARPASGDDTEPIALGPLPRPEAAELFAARSGVAADESNRAAIDAICAALGDVPLAIVIAADAVRVNEIRLDRARQIVGQFLSPVSGLAAEVSITRAYLLAYDTLSDDEERAVAMAASSPGSSIDQPRLGVSDSAIERLKAMSLLEANSPRLSIPAGLRTLALGMYASRRGPAEDEAAIKDRLLANLRAALETRSLDWEFCRDELGNILGLMTWAVEQRRWADAIALGRAVDPYLTLHGLWDAWKAALDRVLLAARQSGDRAAEAWALHQLGTREIGAGTREQAIVFLRRALDARRALGDTIGMAFTQHNLDLLIPPAPPSRPEEPPRPTPDGGRPWLLVAGVAGAVGVVGLIAAVALAAILIWPWLTPPDVPPEVPEDVAGPAISGLFAEPDISYYGAIAEECGSPVAILRATVVDSAEVAQVEVSYRYQAGERAGEWHPAEVADLGGGRYEAVVDHNLDERALRALDGAEGVLHWVVAAADVNGNTSESGDQFVGVQPCLPPDTAGPVITGLVVDPNPSNYGKSATRECPSSLVNFLAVITDESPLEVAQLSYRYEAGELVGEWRQVLFRSLGGDRYGATVDNNADDQALQALDGLNGAIRWRVLAIDTQGNQSESDDQIGRLLFCQ